MSNRILLAVVAVLLAALVYQGPRATAHAQANYEYKVVPVEVTVDTKTGELFPDPHKTKDWRLNDTQLVLDEYSQQGWELASASYWGDILTQPHGKLIFKRRK